MKKTNNRRKDNSFPKKKNQTNRFGSIRRSAEDQEGTDERKPRTGGNDRGKSPGKRKYNPTEKRNPTDKKSTYGKREFDPKKNRGRDFEPKKFPGKKTSNFKSDEKRVYRPEDTYSERTEKRQSKFPVKKKFESNTDIKLRKKSFDKSVPVNKHIKTMHSPTPKGDETMRLNKYLANSGVAARRKCDEFIAAGMVKVNNEVITEMGHRVKQGDKVYFKNKLVEPVNFVYILLNKPKDYITTADDERGRSTVLELVQHATEERVYPVGRLDRNTTGLLLLTNDGDLAQKLSHPKYGAKKLYEVELDKALSPKDLQQIEEGVELEDGLAHVDGIDYAHHSKRNIIGISIHIGKNRIVRRIFEHLGYSVERLDRTMYAGLTKKDLPRGKWRMLNEKEIIKLKFLK